MSMPDPSYWFQIRGDAPLGPMTKAEFFNQHGFEPAEDIRWCAVGHSDWRPLSELLHNLQQIPIQLSGEPTSVTSESTPPSASVPSPDTASAAAAPFPEWLGVLVGVVLFALASYVLYEAARSLTPREVVERFDRCKTIKEAKKHATVNFQPAVETLWKIAAADPDEVPLEIIEEGAGTATEQYIGIRVKNFDKSAGQNVSTTGYITLRKSSDGWKIDDLTIVVADGQPLPKPMSLAQNHLLMHEDLRKRNPAIGSTMPAAATTKHGTDNRNAQKGGVFALWAFIASGGAKAVGFAVLALGGLIYGVFRSRGTTATAS